MARVRRDQRRSVRVGRLFSICRPGRACAVHGLAPCVRRPMPIGLSRWLRTGKFESINSFSSPQKTGLILRLMIALIARDIAIIFGLLDIIDFTRGEGACAFYFCASRCPALLADKGWGIDLRARLRVEMVEYAGRAAINHGRPRTTPSLHNFPFNGGDLSSVDDQVAEWTGARIGTSRRGRRHGHIANDRRSASSCCRAENAHKRKQPALLPERMRRQRKQLTCFFLLR